MTDQSDHVCKTCARHYAMWVCVFCEDSYCINCAAFTAGTVVETLYCGQQCRDASEVRTALHSPEKKRCRNPTCPGVWTVERGLYCSAGCALDDAKGWSGAP